MQVSPQDLEGTPHSWPLRSRPCCILFKVLRPRCVTVVSPFNLSHQTAVYTPYLGASFVGSRGGLCDSQHLVPTFSSFILLFVIDIELNHQVCIGYILLWSLSVSYY